jgi:hypothetical protein
MIISPDSMKDIIFLLIHLLVVISKLVCFTFRQRPRLQFRQGQASLKTPAALAAKAGLFITLILPVCFYCTNITCMILPFGLSLSGLNLKLAARELHTLRGREKQGQQILLQ